MTAPRLTRRQFLGAALGIALAAGTAPLVGCLPVPYAGPGRPLRFLTPKRWAALDAAGRTLWPDLPGLPGAGAVEAATLADELFADANPRLAHDLGHLLDTVEDATWLAGELRPFSTLPPAERAACLAVWRDGPFAIQHRVWAALVRLTGMLTYMRPAAWPAIGYPGPWVGRFDFGQGLDQQGAMASSPNPNVFARWTGG